MNSAEAEYLVRGLLEVAKYNNLEPYFNVILYENYSSLLEQFSYRESKEHSPFSHL